MGVERVELAERPHAVTIPSPFVAPSGSCRQPPDAHRECEKLGVVEALLAAKRYGSILEIGCGRGGLARRLHGRCLRYCGMEADVTTLAQARGTVDEGHFVPLSSPFRLPPGEHELVVLSEVLHLFDTADSRALERALEGHAACREIVVISPRDGDAGQAPNLGGAEFGRFAGALSDRFEAVELAVRRRYRIDALLAR